MDKNKIKEELIRTFIVKEETTPGISVTKAVQDKSKAINKKAISDVDKKMSNYDKEVKKEASGTKDMAQNKFNYNDDANEKEYHDQMEILNGQEMIRYDRVDKLFQERAKEAIEGSSRMGNKGGKDTGNAEETWGASSDDFGKDLVKRIKSSTKKRYDAEDKFTGIGDDVEIDPSKPKTVQHDPRKSHSSISENNNKNNPQIKESMKRLKFKKEFNGVGNALKLIPESYRVDKKMFEMTDGVEAYKIRWEGTLTEGRAVILTATDKNLVSDDISRMKNLYEYKSENTLGLMKGKSRIDENKIFADILEKTKRLMNESEDIEDETAAEGDADDAVKSAPEAKKHIEGSVSTDKGTQAPKPKNGEWEEIKKKAPEATKHVEGSTSDSKGTVAPKPKTGEWEEIKPSKGSNPGEPSSTTYAPAPKTGEWDKINVPQAAEAKKHVTMGESTKGIKIGDSYFTPINESVLTEHHSQDDVPLFSAFKEYLQKGHSVDELKTEIDVFATKL